MREMDLGDLSFSPEEQELLQRMERGAGRRQLSRRHLWWAIAIGYMFLLALGHVGTQLQNQPAAEVPRVLASSPQITSGIRQQANEAAEAYARYNRGVWHRERNQ